MSELELLFFDTFSHESSEEINLDLVQFPKPIYIGEVRIIPLGARVQADFPGGVRLGATNPSQFKIEFFVNDLSKPGAPTFEHLGSIEYNQNGNIHLECENSHIPTDGLVLYGWYTTITLAVYGVLTKSIQPDTSNQPDIVTAEWLQRHHHQSCHAESYNSNKDSYEAEGWGDMHEDKTWERAKERHQDQFRYERRLESGIDRVDTTGNSQQDVGTPEYDGAPTATTRNRQDYYQTGNTANRWSVGSAGSTSWEQRKRPHTPPPPTPPPQSQPSPIQQQQQQQQQVQLQVPQQQQQQPLSQQQQQQQQPPQQPQRTEHREMSPGTSALGQIQIDLSPGDVESISEGDIPETEAGEDATISNNGLVIGVSTGVGAKTPPTPPPPSTPLLNTTGSESPQHCAGNGSVSGNDRGSAATVQEAFEPLSDDELPDDQYQDIDYDFAEYTEDPLKSFNPYNNEISPLKSMEDPASSLYDPSGRRDVSEIISNAEKEALNNLVNALPEDPRNSREVWVETVEQIINCLPKSFINLDESIKNELVNKIMESVAFGLDFTEALSQPQPGLKIRHIKCGIRLVEALSCCGEDVCLKMLETTDAQHLLLNIYHEEYMALVIKLMVLRSLDSTLRYKPCIERFVEFNKKLGQSGYQRLLDMIQGNQHARIKFSLCSLLQKLHFFELLLKLSSTVNELEATIKGSVKIEDDYDKEEFKFDSGFISMALEQILNIYTHAGTMISQPKRFLPVSAQFEINSSGYADPYKAVYTYFRFSNLLKSFITLLSHPGTSCCLSIIAPINSLISELLETDDGMKFLASSKEINSIIRLLLGSSAKVEENQMGSLGVNPTLGLYLAYRLQALSYLDSINNIIDIDPDKPEVLDYLQGLYTLTLSNIGNIGKSSVIHVLCQGENINIMLKVLKNKCTRKRFPSRGYICDLILLCVKLTIYVPFLQKYCDTLIELSKSNFPELAEVQKWLRPIEVSSMGCDIGKICDFIKNNVDVGVTLPGELITAVRLLRYLGIPQNEGDLSPIACSSDYKELKFKCVILDLYSLDGLSHFTSILQKLNKYYEYPHLYSSRLIARQGLLLLSFILPAIQIMRRMLTYVIRCRNTNFKDLTAVPVLLQTYNLLQAIPLNAQAHTDAVRAGREIIETLLAYTQPVSSETCTESEALNKSLWTSMVSEVIKFTIELPINFTSGLMILSELLPLPLPLQTKDPLTEDETARFVNSRKLWSAHLHSLSPILENMIAVMALSSCQPLLQLLRRVCIQLADLAAPTALTVVKTILDTLATLFSANDPKDSQITRLLKFLTCLITHSAVKAAFLSLIKTEKYHSIFQMMLDTFRGHSKVEQNDEYLASIFQYLIDIEISLVPPPGHNCSSITSETFLANTLPPKDILLSICTAMLEHISSEHSFNISLLVVRTFLLLVEHDYGFHHFKSCLEKNGDGLFNLLVQIETKFQIDSPVTLATLSTSLELFRALTNCESVEGFNLNRTALLQTSELISLLKWPQAEHPFVLIEDHLKKAAMDEDKTSERLLESLTCFIKLLEDDSSHTSNTTPLNANTYAGETSGVLSNRDSLSAETPQLPPSESLLGQFALRTVSVLVEGEDDTVLSTAYWLAPPKCDDEETDPNEQISMDLMEIAKKELGGLCLQEALAELCQHKDSNKINDNITNTKNKSNEPCQKKLFIAPMRGRGAYRGVNTMTSTIVTANSGTANVAGGPRGDMFRSRPPNTSRPPSLHVDDFVALETCGGGGGAAMVATPPGYQVPMLSHESVIQDKIGRVRGRGRTFGMERGRFFGSHPYHRETGDAWERIGHQMYSSEVGLGNDPGAGVVPRFFGGIGRIHRGIINPSAVWTNKDAAVQLRGPPQQPQQPSPQPPQPPSQQPPQIPGSVIVGGGRHMRFFSR